MILRLATRPSEQSILQTKFVAELITSKLGIQTEIVTVATHGDKDKTTPIAQMGGRGIFAKEVQELVLANRADLAVHSAKDLPSSWCTEGLILACVPHRGDHRDALVGSTLEGLEVGATVASGSVRRRAQLSHLRPDLNFVDLRGNTPTRVSRAEETGISAVVGAVAGIDWVGLGHKIAQILSVDLMIPQVGQGALAIECRVGDSQAREVLAEIENKDARRCVDAERSFLATLGGGCNFPVGAFAQLDGDRLEIVGVISSLDGQTLFRDRMYGEDESVGAHLAKVLLDAGGSELLA